MSDQDPQNGPSATPKKETVRITLPPKPSDVPLVKRETVRIDVGSKGETMKVDVPPPSPKKESTRIAPLISGSAAGISNAPAAPKSFTPPPSAPKAPGGLPTPPRPPGSAPAAPGFGVKPSLPVKPAPPGAIPVVPAAATPPSAPVQAPPPGLIKPSAPAESPVVSKAAPKKETSRISLNPEPKKMPQATVKLQQTQPLAQGPAPMIRSTATTLPAAEEAAADSATFILSCAAAGISLVAIVLAYLAYSA